MASGSALVTGGIGWCGALGDHFVGISDLFSLFRFAAQPHLWHAQRWDFTVALAEFEFAGSANWGTGERDASGCHAGGCKVGCGDAALTIQLGLNFWIL